jgi:hypothetical protein
VKKRYTSQPGVFHNISFVIHGCGKLVKNVKNNEKLFAKLQVMCEKQRLFLAKTTSNFLEHVSRVFTIN